MPKSAEKGRKAPLNKVELRQVRHARVILLDYARSIRDGHTDTGGDWGDEVEARAWHDDILKTSEHLRAIAVGHKVSA